MACCCAIEAVDVAVVTTQYSSMQRMFQDFEVGQAGRMMGAVAQEGAAEVVWVEKVGLEQPNISSPSPTWQLMPPGLPYEQR